MKIGVFLIVGMLLVTPSYLYSNESALEGLYKTSLMYLNDDCKLDYFDNILFGLTFIDTSVSNNFHNKFIDRKNSFTRKKIVIDGEDFPLEPLCMSSEEVIDYVTWIIKETISKNIVTNNLSNKVRLYQNNDPKKSVAITMFENKGRSIKYISEYSKSSIVVIDTNVSASFTENDVKKYISELLNFSDQLDQYVITTSTLNDDELTIYNVSNKIDVFSWKRNFKVVCVKGAMIIAIKNWMPAHTGRPPSNSDMFF